jgi:hypothetical protein
MKQIAAIAVVICLSGTLILSAQKKGKNAPWLSITISENRHDFRGPGKYDLEIKLTNTSDLPHHLEACAVSRGLYTASVIYDGTPLQEQNALERRQSEERMRHSYCKFDVVSLDIPPGGSTSDDMLVGAMYDMSRRGMYEITLTRQLGRYESSSEPVTSNKLKIVVP